MKFDCFVFLENLSRKFKFSLTRITGTLHGDVCTFMIISFRILLSMWNVSNKVCRENQNMHFTCIFKNFFQKLCRLWDHVRYGRAGQATDDNIIRRMLFACWITKSTGTHRIRNSYCFYTTTVVTRTRLNVSFKGTLPVVLWICRW
jgi:hypothetical protein